MKFTDLLLGKRLKSADADEEKIGPFKGLPSLGLDGLSSAAYGPEAALAILIPLGAMGLAYILPITGLILLLLFILYFSYRSSIRTGSSRSSFRNWSRPNGTSGSCTTTKPRP